ncbi:M20 family metallopeptidase [Synergistaceae bacterium OttesenSCG-928-D05]|nr:M20 family metallopeptidase [Synergistaceae bacterium OttesenSCG-928-D05]
MEDFADIIASQIEEFSDVIVKDRRYIHARPEIGFETKNTETYIRSILIKEGIEILPSTIGVVAKISAPDNVDDYIALRADIDAIHVEEQNQVEYKSLTKGTMHACGHDAHTAMLLGAARVINRNRSALQNSILLIFQPAAEGPLGGGARVLLEDFEKMGLLSNIQAIAALHMNSELKSGKVGIKYETVLGSLDDFDVEIIGKGGHGGWPHKAKDALAMGVKFVYEMESFMSRGVDPLDPAVFAVGTFHAGDSRNTIAESVSISGTVRAQSEETRERICEGARRLLKGLSVYSNTECRIDIRKGVPALVNNDEKVMQAEIIAKMALGNDKVEVMKKAAMGADDFAIFAQTIPAAFIWLGTFNPAKNCTEIMHSPKFNIDEDVLPTGALLLCHIAFAMK